VREVREVIKEWLGEVMLRLIKGYTSHCHEGNANEAK
jgi:hypothetical protein